MTDNSDHTFRRLISLNITLINYLLFIYEHPNFSKSRMGIISDPH